MAAYIEEWSSKLRHCTQNGKVLSSTPLGALLGFGTQPRYEAPRDLQVEYLKSQ